MDLFSERNGRICYAVLAAVIVGCAILLRIPGLGETTLWFDEAVFANNSLADFSTFIQNTRERNSCPIALPLLYWIFGAALHTPFLIRLPPLLFSVLAVLVLLNLHRVGLSRWIAITSALWLTLLPIQILYGQEVREYSLAVFTTTLLLFSFLQAIQPVAGNRKFPFGFCLLLFLTPFLSYGNIFIAAILLTLFVFLPTGKKDFYTIVLPPSVFGLAVWISYSITAKYQMHVATTWYLLPFYPRAGNVLDLEWFGSANLNYFHFLLDVSPWSALPLLALFLALVLRRRTWKFPELYVVLSCLALIVSSNALAFLVMYPFGGIRQHLFAAPLLMVGLVSACLWTAKTARQWLEPLVALLFFVVFIVPWGSQLTRVYGEKEDILSAITDIPPWIQDESVYIFPESVPAVSFHFPDRSFHFPSAEKTHIQQSVDEIMNMPGCRVGLVFSRTFKKEDEAIVSRMVQKGANMLLEHRYQGANLVVMNKCLEQ